MYQPPLLSDEADEAHMSSYRLSFMQQTCVPTHTHTRRAGYETPVGPNGRTSGATYDFKRDPLGLQRNERLLNFISVIH